jgi:hypothetical protein
LLGGDVLKAVLQKSGLTAQILSELWRLSDIDKDGKFTFAEFVIAMHLLKVFYFCNCIFFFVLFLFRWERIIALYPCLFHINLLFSASRNTKIQ